VNNSDTTAKAVPVKVGDVFEDRIFSVLTVQIKQAVKTRLFNAMFSLKALKQSTDVGRAREPRSRPGRCDPNESFLLQALWSRGRSE